MSEELAALIARVEAGEPSFDLDEAIAHATGWTFHIDQHDDDMTEDVWTDPSGKQHPCHPFYTLRIDDALKLMPEGWFVNSLTEYNQRTWGATLRGPWTGETRLYSNSRSDDGPASPTAALALVAAALKARMATPKNPVDDGREGVA